MDKREEIINLDPEDSFAAIRNRLAQARGDIVYLGVPRDCAGSKGPVHLRLLQRLSLNLPLRLVLITPDPALKSSARRLGIPTFLSVDEAHRTPMDEWSRPRSLVKKEAPLRSQSRPLFRDGRRFATTTLEAARPQRGEVLLLLSLVGGLLFLAALGGFLLLPGAEVRLQPGSYAFAGTFQMRVDPFAIAVDAENLTVPAQILEVELLGREGIPTSSRKDLPDQAAQGEVVFVNRTADAVVIPKGTVVSTSAGVYIRFRTSEEVFLPGGFGSLVRVPMEALEPGPSGNVPALAINRVEGSLSFQVRAVNDLPTQGGTARQVPFVTLEDKSNLKQSLLQRLWQEARSTLEGQLQGSFLLPGSPELFVIVENYDHLVGEEAAALSLELRVRAQGVTVKESDLTALAQSALKSAAGPGFEVIPGTLEFILGEPTREEDGEILVTMTVRGRKMAALDEEDLKSALAAKSVDQAVDYLKSQLSLADDPQIVITPLGWPLMPWIAARIDISILPGGN